MRNKRGFSLIEILVVILIIGIMAGLAVIAFGDFGSSRKVNLAAEQLLSYIKLVQQQAILESNTLKISFQENSYKTYQFTGSSWALINKSPFRIHYFPKTADVLLQHTFQKEINGFSILVNALGIMTPFEMKFYAKPQQLEATLIGKYNGDLILK